MARTKAFKEEEVLAKAMDLFWTNGYHATSVQHLVNHLGINRASIYDTFGDKKGLFDRALNCYLNASRTQVKNFLNEHKDVKEGFRALFAHSIIEVEKDPNRKGCFVVNTVTELVPKDEELSLLMQSNQEALEAIFHQYLEEGQENGSVKAGIDVQATASMFYVIYNGLMVSTKVKCRRAEFERMLAVALSVI